MPLRDVATMTERVHRSTTIPRFSGLLFSFFAVLALALALTGIYGIMAHHVNQRRRETAIRRALGATSRQMLTSTLGAGLRLALVGIVLGTGAALAVTRSMAALLYRVDPRDPASSPASRRFLPRPRWSRASSLRCAPPRSIRRPCCATSKTSLADSHG